MAPVHPQFRALIEPDLHETEMSEKHANFHRVAERRTDSIVDALRVLSNLSGPSYEWSPAEVMAYLDRIDAAKEEALARFKETKRWRTATPLDGAESPAPEAAAEMADEIDAATESDEVDEDQDVDQVSVALKPADKPAPHKGHPRSLTIAQIMAECADDREMLAEMVRLQRMLIHDQAQRLGEKAEYPTVNAA
jgi:hypothetical protein